MATHNLRISNITIRSLNAAKDEDKTVSVYLEFDVQGAKAKTAVAKVTGETHDFTTSSVEAKHLPESGAATLEVYAYRKRTLLPDHLIGSGAVKLEKPDCGQTATVELHDKGDVTVGIVEFRIAGDSNDTSDGNTGNTAGAGTGAGVGAGSAIGRSGAGTNAAVTAGTGATTGAATLSATGTDPADSTATDAKVNAANDAALSAARDNRSTASATKEDLAAEQARANTNTTGYGAGANNNTVEYEAADRTNATADEASGRTLNTADKAQGKLQEWKEGLLEKNAEARDKRRSPAETTPVNSSYNSAIGIPPEAGHVSDAPGSSTVANTPVDYAAGSAGGATSGAVAPTGAGAVIPGTVASGGVAATGASTGGLGLGGTTNQGATWTEKLRGVAVGAIDKTAEALEAAKIHLTSDKATAQGSTTGATAAHGTQGTTDTTHLAREA